VSFAEVVERLRTLTNPYPGLRHFDVAESHLFFGRDLQVAELVRRLERLRFVAALGVSGSGKSSLVSAGLIPALERGGVSEAGRRWRRGIMRPAGAPFEQLRAELERIGVDASRLRESSHGLIHAARSLPGDETLLLVVDQFEELFRYKDIEPITDEARRTRARQATDAAEFVQLLLEAGEHQPPIYIVLTMRSDYLGDCAEFRDFPEKLNDCQYLVPRMTRQQRKEAIEGPLGRVKIAPALVQRLLNDAGDEPGQLPVLQHALMRTWNQWRRSDPRETRAIELQDYLEVGGFDGALNRHADELLAQGGEDIAECLFKRLTARGRSNRERRDPATLAELWAVCGATTPDRRNQVTGVIDRFRQGDATFLRPLAGELAPGDYVDITHESLIKLWRKLHDVWLPEEQLAAKTLVEVAERARNRQDQSGELLTGLDLARVEDWDRHRNKTAAWAEHYVDGATFGDALAFIEASRLNERQLKEQARLEARARVRRRRAVAFAAAAVIVAAIGYGLVSYFREQQRLQTLTAQRAVAVAEAEQQQAETLRAQAERDLVAAQTEVVQAKAASTPAPPPALGSAPAPSEVAPRVYIQVLNQDELLRARSLAAPLRDAGFVVPRPEVVGTGPSANEVRFFRNAERDKAEQIVAVVSKSGAANTRSVYVSGYEDSRGVRPNHFELWLAPADLLPTLVQQLNDQSPDVRKAAGARLARDHRSNPDAIRLVLETLSAQKLPSLSSDGRINALYFLGRSDPKAWNDEHMRLGREAVMRILNDRTAGVGPQTGDELRRLQQLVSPAKTKS
jgi:hypothetical protein